MQPAGCDNILYSNKQYDNCGVCNGDNSSCDEISQSVKVPTAYGKTKTYPNQHCQVFTFLIYFCKENFLIFFSFGKRNY